MGFFTRIEGQGCMNRVKNHDIIHRSDKWRLQPTYIRPWGAGGPRVYVLITNNGDLPSVFRLLMIVSFLSPI